VRPRPRPQPATRSLAAFHKLQSHPVGQDMLSVHDQERFSTPSAAWFSLLTASRRAASSWLGAQRAAQPNCCSPYTDAHLFEPTTKASLQEVVRHIEKNVEAQYRIQQLVRVRGPREKGGELRD
jgi:hypothetical protein